MGNQHGGFVSRRDFVKGTAALSAASLLVNPGAVFSQGQETIRLGVIGCGGRGSGALGDCLNAAKHLNLNAEVVALGDFFMEQAVETARLYDVPQERCFAGADAYKKVIAANPDVVLLTAPPNFRPLHFDAAVKAGKHVFMEKPVAVDPPGVRKVIETGKLADEKKLAVVAGTQRRHEAVYRQTAYAVQNGAIGRLMSGKVWWCASLSGSRSRPHPRQENEPDSSYMVRNWLNFSEMSGDHIVELHVHQLDVANWFIGRPPESALGFGGRARRWTGNQYDFFTVDFDYGDDVHIHSMCRLVDVCYNRINEYFIGTDGSTWGGGPGRRGYKKAIQLPDFEEHGGPYVQEHIHLLDGIIKGEPLNEAQNVAESTLATIMGRISAYSGQMVRWRELVDPAVNSPWYNLTLTPTAEDFETSTVTAPPDDIIPIPGRA